jgi:hypothetical protein
MVRANTRGTPEERIHGARRIHERLVEDLDLFQR